MSPFLMHLLGLCTVTKKKYSYTKSQGLVVTYPILNQCFSCILGVHTYQNEVSNIFQRGGGTKSVQNPDLLTSHQYCLQKDRQLFKIKTEMSIFMWCCCSSFI